MAKIIRISHMFGLLTFGWAAKFGFRGAFSNNIIKKIFYRYILFNILNRFNDLQMIVHSELLKFNKIIS